MRAWLCGSVLIALACACGEVKSHSADGADAAEAQPAPPDGGVEVPSPAEGVPQPPESVKAEGIASGLRVQWTPAREGPQSGMFVVRFQGEQWGKMAGADARSLELTQLLDGRQYTVGVYAVNAAGESLPTFATARAGVVPPPGPEWIAGAQMPVRALGALVAQGRLWIVGLDPPTLAVKTASAALDDRELPVAWQTAKEAPSYTTEYAGWASGPSARLFGVGASSLSPAPGIADSAALFGDGTTGPWRPASVTPELNLSHPGAVADESDLFLFGGSWWSGGSFSGYGTDVPFVYVGSLAPDGSVTGWRRTTPLPRAGQPKASALDGRIYVLLPRADGSTVVYGERESDGSMGAWKQTSAPGGFTHLASAAGHLYALDADGTLLLARVASEGDVTGWEVEPFGAFPDPFAVLAGSSDHLYWMSGVTVLVAAVDPATGHIAWRGQQSPVLRRMKFVSKARGPRACPDWNSPARRSTHSRPPDSRSGRSTRPGQVRGHPRLRSFHGPPRLGFPASNSALRARMRTSPEVRCS
jgi:fibronectin type III domain protein